MKKISRWDRFFMMTVSCRGCGGKLRFPLNKGKLRVTCPHCRAWFIFSYHPGIWGDLFRRRWLGRQSPNSRDGGAVAQRDPSVKNKMVVIFSIAVLIVILINVCRVSGRREPVPVNTIETVD